MRDIIAHLFTEYRQVEYQDLVGNISKLLEPWDSNRPFQELLQCVQEIQEFANDGRQTISDKEIVNTIYTLVHDTGLFYNNCDKWDSKQHNNKPGQTSRLTSMQRSGIKKLNIKYQPARGDTMEQTT